MNKTKTMLAAMLAAGMLAGVGLSGCSSDKGEQGGAASAAPGAATASATAASNKPVTLKVLLSGYGTLQDTGKVLEEANKVLGQLLPNTQMNVEFVPAEQYEEKLRLLISAGEQVDVANFANGIGSAKNDLVVEAKKGTMMALDDLIKATPDLTNEIPASVFERGKVEGKLYEVPIYQTVTDKFIGIKMHKELVDQYMGADTLAKLKTTLDNNGVLTKDTYDILTAYLKNLKDNNQIRRGVSVETMAWLPQKGYYSLYNWAFVVKKEDNSSKVLNYFEQPEVKMMYDVHTDWYQKGYVEKDILSMQNRRQYEKKVDGNVLAMTTQNVSDPAFPEMDSDINDTKAYGFPVTTVAWAKNYVIGPGNMQGLIIPRTAKNPERAMQLIELLNTQKGLELQQLLSYGIEGTHYTRDEKGAITPLVKDAAQAKYAAMNWNIGNLLLKDPKSKDTYPDFIREVANKKALAMPLAGFKLDIEPIKSELAQFDAARKEFELGLYSGASSKVDELYQQMIDKMKKAGSDKIIAEMQKQVDAYLKTAGK